MYQLIPGYYDTPGTANILKVTRTAVAKIAKKEGWKIYPIGNGSVNLYPVDDVHKYRDHRYRTQLVKKLGWVGRGLYRNSDIDIECPVCEAFAVEWPPPPESPLVYLCLNGHEGKT